ncbi:MAG: efflux RND transporter periplasmic adaptor subunit [Bacteroidaceae bacterium]
MNTLKRLFLPLCSIFIVGAYLSSCSSSKGDKKETIYKVTAIYPTDSTSADSKQYIGLLEGNKTSSLSFQVPGQLASIRIQEGQRVQKGTLLASLDATNLNSQLNAAKATFEQAEDAYHRLKILYDNGSLPEIKFVEVKTKVKQADAAYTIAQKNLKESNLYAPFSGLIGKRAVQVGENVFPGKEVLTLIDTQKIKMRFDVPEQEINLIHVGDESEVVVGALGNQKFKAKVTERRLDANSITHNYSTYVTLIDNNDDMIPGMASEVRLLEKSTSDQNTSAGLMILPVSCVQVTMSGEHYVWIVQDSLAARKRVEIGGLVSGGLVIKSGLSKQDLVITEGYHKISIGNKIQVNK